MLGPFKAPFYGWYIVLLAFAAGFFSISAMNMVFSVMLNPMAQDLGWSRAALAGAGSVGVILASLVSPIPGRLVDVHGPKLVSGFAAVAVGLILVLISRINVLWQFYILYSLGRVLSYNGRQLVRQESS